MSAVSHPSTSHHRWFISVLIVVVSLMVGGGLTARELYRQPERSPGAVLALPSATALPPSEQPGPATVELTPDAVAHPEHEVVRALMQDYFNAINSRDYDSWKATVTRARVEAKPRLQWLSDYRTVKDGSILIYRIDSLPNNNLRVFLAFTSTQDPSVAPEELPEACVRWNLVLPLTREAGYLQVDAVTGATVPELSHC